METIVDFVIPLVLTIIIALLLFFVIIFGAAQLFIRTLASRNLTAALERFPQAHTLGRDALMFGQESKGVTQFRGNGTLLLTERELYFRKWITNIEHIIPLGSIISIERPRVFLGKTYGKPLLKINYQRDDGQRDSIAWYVRDLESAIAQIEAMRARATG